MKYPEECCTMFYRGNKELGNVVIAVNRSVQPHLKYVQIQAKATKDNDDSSPWTIHPVIRKTTLPESVKECQHGSDVKKNAIHKIMHSLQKLNAPTVAVIDPAVRISLDPNTVPVENPPKMSSSDTIFVR